MVIDVPNVEYTSDFLLGQNCFAVATVISTCNGVFSACNEVVRVQKCVCALFTYRLPGD